MSYNLPVELLQYVFMLLSPCTDLLTVLNVCQRWREVGKSVLKIRENMCLSAFKLRSPLVWVSPKLNMSIARKRFAIPSKRFGSTAVMYEQSMYVFGGATRELTTFNDLWAYDLSTSNWRRVIGKGDLPTPRAHATGGTIGDKLYFYGGCQCSHRPGSEHTGRMDWLTELNCFRPTTMCWSRTTLHQVNNPNPESPTVIAGQSGCFLPAGGIGEPSLLILFGGVSQTHGSCINDLYVLSPEEGRWISFSGNRSMINEDMSWPIGRCGHSCCALDANRMLLLFGNSLSPLSNSFTHTNRQSNSNGADEPADEIAVTHQYRGRPTGDMWILTRCQPQPGQDWTMVDWFWTEVQLPNSPLSNSPPIDFYHTVAITLPYEDTHQQQNLVEEATFDEISPIDLFNNSSNDTAKFVEQFQPHNTRRKVYNVIVVSQPTQLLLEEAVRQRKYWQRTKVNSELINSAKLSSSYFKYAGVLESKSCAASSSTTDTISTSNISDQPTSSTIDRRVNNRRAKQLEALAIQERRLFGAHRICPQSDSGSSTSSSTLPNYSSDSLSHNRLSPGSAGGINIYHRIAPPTRPLALYSLQITLSPIDEHDTTHQSYQRSTYDKFKLELTQMAEADWLIPLKPNFIDLFYGPPECLGYSCTFGYGCLFLFGGLTESDESENANGSDYHLQSLRKDFICSNNDLQQSVGDAASSSSSPTDYTEFNTVRMAQFFALCPRSLVGTVV